MEEEIFGLAASKPTWHKAPASERRKLVVEDVHRQEETTRNAKATQQGQWVRWERPGEEKDQLE